MLISLNEIKKLVDVKISDDQLFQLIGSRLVEIERIEDLAPKYKKIYVAKVKSAQPIEGTHLHLCQIDAGAKLNAEVDPAHDGYVQVVCGAPNVKAGMLAAWISPGAIVPATFGTPEPFEISARKLRGFESFGMLAAADELALGDDHAGIIELDPKTAQPGDLLADVLDLNDKIIEVENKSLTHRPDCFGLIGFAREVAGILGQPFNYDQKSIDATCAEIHQKLATSPAGLPISATIADFSICPCYQALVFRFADLPTRTPYLTTDDIFLVKAGMRPISPIVDATNFIMLMTGQPLHAFDYDKFVRVGGNDTAKITVRLARVDEKLLTLDGKEITLNANDIIICSGDTPVALAGAIGGQSTEIDAETKTIIVETASFSLYNLRKTQMSHGIFSEAITRFTKGRPATDLDAAYAKQYHLMTKLGGELCSGAKDSDPSIYGKNGYALPTVTVSVKDINALLGSDYSKELIINTLANVDFTILELKDGELEITAPYWRTDIHIKEDIIEEVGRLLGFDNLPLDFPRRPFVCPELDPMLAFKSQLRTILSDRLGMNEVLTYSFVSKSLQEKTGEDPENSYQIINSISPELECFRQSLVPSLLDKIRENEKSGFADFALYELNQVSQKSWGLTDENVPQMQTHLGLTTFGDFYHAKQVLLELAKSLNLAFELKPLAASNFLELLHAAAIYLDGKEIGELGEVKNSVLKRFKLNAPLSVLEFSLEPCLGAKTNRKFGIKLSKFPFVSRDLTFRVPKTVAFAEVEAKIKTILSRIPAIIYKLEPVSIYRKPIEPTKNLSFHLEIAHTEKTLASSEVSDIIETIVKELQTLGAEVV